MSRAVLNSVAVMAALTAWSCSRPTSPPPQAPADSAAVDGDAVPATEPMPTTATPEAAASASDATGQPVDPESVLRRVAEFYQHVDTLQVESEQVMRMTGPGIDNRMTARRVIAAARPNRVAIRTEEGMASLELISDGEKLVTYIPSMNQYSESDAGEDFSALLTHPLVMSGAATGQISFAVQLLADDPYAKLMEGVTQVDYVGRETLEGHSVHRVRCTQDEFDWEVWVQAEGDPLLVQAAIDMSKAMAQFAARVGGVDKMQVVMTESLRNWKINAPLDEQTFVFTPPEDAEKVDSFFGGRDEPELSPLLGQSAPPVQLALLDGGSLSLENHAGQQIVMLDFWATWCGPCVAEMPLLAEVADEYRDKGVVFYAVNQREEPEEIQKFLEEQGLSLTVALDSEGAVGDAYGVQGIPMLVLIDKQGTVQSVHVGYRQDIKEVLRKELDDLLAGKNLAEEAKAAAESSEGPPENAPGNEAGDTPAADGTPSEPAVEDGR